MKSANLGAAFMYAALTCLATYPQVRDITTAVPYNPDPYFSMWRLDWIAHALRTAPASLFDANIFYPERLTLAYSDAMLLPGFLLAPLLWMGTNAVAIYNLTLLAAFTLSGLAAFSLARLVTATVGGSLVAGMIYAFAPFYPLRAPGAAAGVLDSAPIVDDSSNSTLPDDTKGCADRRDPGFSSLQRAPTGRNQRTTGRSNWMGGSLPRQSGRVAIIGHRPSKTSRP